MPHSNHLPPQLALLPQNEILRAAQGNQSTVERGWQLAGSDLVSAVTWDSNSRVIRGKVQGSRPSPYTTSIFFSIPQQGMRVLSTSCTCPMMLGCKHVVALLLDARTIADHQRSRKSASQPKPVEPLWQRQLAHLVRPQSDPATKLSADALNTLGLQFRVDGITAALDPGGRTATPELSLSVRPVTKAPGRRWETPSGLTWRGNSYYSSWAFPQDQLNWLCSLADLNPEIKHDYWNGNARWQLLSGFVDAAVWPILREGQRLGVSFVGNAARDVVQMAGVAEIQANLVRGADDVLTLSRLVLVDGQPLRSTLMGAVGKGGLFTVDVGSSTRLVTIAPVGHRLTDDDLALLGLGAVQVPASDIDTFMGSYYPVLRQRISITSSNNSVDLPAPPRPVLVGQVVVESVHKIDVTWSWRYGAAIHSFDDAQVPRVGQIERDITDAVERILWAHAGFQLSQLGNHQTFEGLLARTFVDDVLPDLEACPDVEMTIVDQLPTYWDIDEPARITVSATDSGDNDWFDLGIEITAAGYQVPFQQLFIALASGQTRLVLDNGAVVAIDTPEFAHLRQLIDEARALGDTQSKSLRINRYQPGLWSELTDLADIVEQSESWASSVGQLIELVNSGGAVEQVALPASLVAVLRPYQQLGYQWLTFLDAHRLGGILADDMGLGKTVEILAWIAGAVERGASDSPYLVVCPASVVGNWKFEAARFTPQLRVTALTQSAKRLNMTVDDLAATADVVVTSYAIFRLNYDDFSQIAWSALILDEAQFVKNRATAGNELARRLPARVKFAVTGTPLENDVMELWALLSIVAPGFGGTARQFKELYGRPIKQAAMTRQALRAASRGARPDETELLSQGDQRLAQLRRRLKPLLLRRTKELVTPELPTRLEQVVDVELAPRHRSIYDTYLQRERQRVLGLLDNLDKNRFAIFRSLTILRRLALDASLIEPVKYATVACAKLDILFEQLNEVVASGHRALIFSQFTTFLAKVVARLDRADIDYCYLDGSTRNRDRVIERFRTQDVPVFCLSLKAGGFGLNLTEADYVFLLDPWWNPATEQQAIDRTHRIGQTRNVMVVRLVSGGTIENKVMDLQARKREVFNAVLSDNEGEASFASALSAEDIKGLLFD